MTGQNDQVLESRRQQDKEKAVLAALNKDMALIRRDLDIYDMKKDGSLIFISKSGFYEDLWRDALKVLNDF